MSIYDVLMTALLLAGVFAMVINHRTGWLASRVTRTSRQSPGMAYPRRRLIDADDRPVEFTRTSPTLHD